MPGSSPVAVVTRVEAGGSSVRTEPTRRASGRRVLAEHEMISALWRPKRSTPGGGDAAEASSTRSPPSMRSSMPTARASSRATGALIAGPSSPGAPAGPAPITVVLLRPHRPQQFRHRSSRSDDADGPVRLPRLPTGPGRRPPSRQAVFTISGCTTTATLPTIWLRTSSSDFARNTTRSAGSV